MGNRVSSLLTRFLIFSVVISLPLSVCAQSKERPKHKDFGSSLKRTQWDPDRQQAVVAKPTPTVKSKDDDLDVVKVETSLVSSDVLVYDARGNIVDGLTENDFVISEDGAPQKLGMFSLGTNSNVARTIVLIIDYSGSQLPFIETSIAAAKTMIDKLGPFDRIAIVDDDVEMIQDFTTDKKVLKGKLESLRKRATAGGFLSNRRLGASKQYSALFATLNEAFDSDDKRPIVIFQTDGDEVGVLRNSPIDSLPSPLSSGQEQALRYLSENRTSFSLEDIHRAAERARATIYTVMPGFRIIGLSRDEQLKQVSANLEQRLLVMQTQLRHKMPDALRQRMFQPEMLEYNRQASVVVQTALASVAIESGGWLMFMDRPEQADETYSLILSDINRRYLVGYYPTKKEHDGKRRQIAVTVRDHPDYKVIGRKWYYAPAADQ